MAVWSVPAALYMGSITKADGTGGTRVNDIDENSIHIAIATTGRRRRMRNRHLRRPLIWTADATVTVKLMSNDQEGLDRILAFFSGTDLAKGNLNPLPGEQKKNVGLLIVPEATSSKHLFYSPEVSVEGVPAHLYYDRQVALLEGNYVTFACHQWAGYDTEPPWTMGVAATIEAAHTEITT